MGGTNEIQQLLKQTEGEGNVTELHFIDRAIDVRLPYFF
jgi:hypothetical protein